MSSSESETLDDDNSQRESIREELRSMTFEEIMKLKEELGSKVYKEAVLGTDEGNSETNASTSSGNFKRLNKNRPREISSKRQVPFLGAELRSQRTVKGDSEIRDPRFDDKSGTYDTKQFKQNYKFVAEIREKEIERLRKELQNSANDDERSQLKQTIQRLVNKNVEDRNWHNKQSMLMEEKKEVQKARDEGRQPHFVTKGERRAKELVAKFEELQKTGKLSKHLEKRRKKNAAKDRKKFSFD